MLLRILFCCLSVFIGLGSCCSSCITKSPEHFSINDKWGGPIHVGSGEATFLSVDEGGAYIVWEEKGFHEAYCSPTGCTTSGIFFTDGVIRVMSDMAKDGQGGLHVVWSHIIPIDEWADGRELFYQKRDPSTGQWTPPIMISQPAQYISPTAILDAGMYRIAASSTQSLIGYTEQKTSTDFVPQYLGGELVLFQNALGAESWTMAARITNLDGVNNIAVDYTTGAFHLAGTDVSSQSFIMTVSPDGQKSMEQLGFVPPMRSSSLLHLAYNLEGTHVAWPEGGERRTDPAQIYYALRQGGVWSLPEKIYDSAQSSQVVTMAADDTRVIVVIADNTDSTTGGAYDLFYLIKEKGVWTQDRLTNTSKESYGSGIGIDATGRIHIIWNEVGSDSDVYYSWYPK